MYLELIRRSSITDDAYLRIRDAIFSGVLTSGQRLDVGRLAESFGVSNQPVKEALQRLTMEGLTVIKPRSGTFVRILTIDDIHHILEARLMIETFAVSCISNPDSDLLRILGEKAIALKRLSHEQPFQYDLYNDTDIGFHETLVQMSENPELLRLYRSLHSHFVTARVYFITALEKTFANEDDHQSIYQALVHRDSAQARNIVEQHISDAKEGIIRLVQSGGIQL